MNNQKKQQIDSSNYSIQYYCKCSINGVQFLPQNIIRLNFGEWIFDVLPRLDLSIVDNGKFFDRFPIQENDVVKIEISRNSNTDPSIVLEFNIVDYDVTPSDPNFSRNSVMTISGILKNKELFNPLRIRSFSRQSSEKVLQSIASNAGLDVQTKIRCPDSMNWIQANMSDLDMIKYVTMNSFLTTSDCNFSYTNRQSKFVFTSLNTELKNPVKFKLIHNPERVLDIKNSHDKSHNSHKKSKDKELYYASYKAMNFSGSVNKNGAYGVSNNYWNLEKNKTAKVVSDKHQLTKFSFKEKDKVGITASSDTICYNSDNQHKNFQLAQTQNKYIRDNFFANCLFVFINSNDEINLFDKVFMSVPTLDGGSDVNEVHSGEYIVGGIYHEIGKDSIYKMMVALFRNGMNKSSYMNISDYRVNGS